MYLRLRMDFGKSAMPWPVIHRSTLSFFNLGGRYLRPASVTLVFSSFKLFNEAGRSYAIILDKCVRTKPKLHCRSQIGPYLNSFVCNLRAATQVEMHKVGRQIPKPIVSDA